MKRYWTNLSDLQAAGMIESIEPLAEVEKNFQTKIGPPLQTQIASFSEDDAAYRALTRQFIPAIEEKTILPRELDDPIGDHRHSPVEGVVHRYPDRALLKVTQLCEVYCRFCFRKEMIGHKGENLSQAELDTAYHYFESHPEVREVILTGGDPMILSNRRLMTIMRHLAEIPHIKVIRIHTRIPILNPERVDRELAEFLKSLRTEKGVQILVVIHANHAAEFSESARGAINCLLDHRVMLISQSVMLKGVNDNFKALSELMYTLVDFGIKPYYLHQMDLARGTSHFVVEEARAIALIHELREKVSGICVPHLIQEIPAGEGKKALY